MCVCAGVYLLCLHCDPKTPSIYPAAGMAVIVFMAKHCKHTHTHMGKYRPSASRAQETYRRIQAMCIHHALIPCAAIHRRFPRSRRYVACVAERDWCGGAVLCTSYIVRWFVCLLFSKSEMGKWKMDLIFNGFSDTRRASEDERQRFSARHCAYSGYYVYSRKRLSWQQQQQRDYRKQLLGGSFLCVCVMRWSR